MPDGTTRAPISSSTLFDRLPPEILAGLSARQKSAIAAAADVRGWQPHRVNIRLTLPILPRRWYLTVVAGPERRSAQRRQVERRRHPLHTAGNIAFVFMTAVAFYGIAVGAILFSSKILEY